MPTKIETTPTPHVYQALSAAMADISHVGKTGRNTSQNFNFRGIDAVVNAAGPAFRRHGIIPVPEVLKYETEDTKTGNGKAVKTVEVTVRYRFYGPAGDYVDAVVVAESFDFGDKGTAKAMSVAFRTALLQVLCLPTDEPDPDEHTFERAAAPEYPEPSYAFKTAADARAAYGKHRAAGAPDAVLAKIVQAGKDLAAAEKAMEVPEDLAKDEAPV